MNLFFAMFFSFFYHTLRFVSAEMHRKIVFQLTKTPFSSSPKTLIATFFTRTEYAGDDDHLYADIPKPRRDKSERKPYPTPMKDLIRKAKEEKEARKAQPCRMLEDPPDNGILVPELVEVAHRVHHARHSLLSGLRKLVRFIPVHRCRFCTEVHIGHAGHEIRTCLGPKSGSRSATHVWRRGCVRNVVFFPRSYHLSDRVGKARVVHDDRYSIPRIPAVLELCIQAGVDIEEFPTKRRTKPVYSIEGRIVDFEDVGRDDEMSEGFMLENRDSQMELDQCVGTREETENPSFSQEWRDLERDKDGLKELSVLTMKSWFEMVSGVKQIMERYKVWTCGYCTEVQVGPKGHKVRMCKARKHQMRDGMHAWQEATIDDIVGPNYVWHVRDLGKPVLDNSLKKFYGKAPAVVEICVQVGAPVPEEYRSMMRLDVVPPGRDEVDLVA